MPAEAATAADAEDGEDGEEADAAVAERAHTALCGTLVGSLRQLGFAPAHPVLALLWERAAPAAAAAGSAHEVGALAALRGACSAPAVEGPEEGDAAAAPRQLLRRFPPADSAAAAAAAATADAATTAAAAAGRAQWEQALDPMVVGVALRGAARVGGEVAVDEEEGRPSNAQAHCDRTLVAQPVADAARYLCGSWLSRSGGVAGVGSGAGAGAGAGDGVGAGIGVGSG